MYRKYEENRPILPAHGRTVSMRSTVSLRRAALLRGGTILLALGLAAPLAAQPANEGDPDCIPPIHRLRLWAGPGNARIQTGILSEGEPAWTVNSFIEGAESERGQPVIPIIPPKPIQALSLHGGIDYSYNDRLSFGYRVYSVNQEFARDDTTRITYYAPANRNFRWAIFEGIRLQRYVEDRRTGDVTYLHPVGLPGLKAGGFVERERYIEINDISLGSFQATKGNSSFKPYTSTWSEAGVIPGEYRMWGTHPGLALQLQMFSFLGFTYRAAAVNREGTFKMSGVQYLTEDLNGGYTQANAVFPYVYAETKDSGQRHNLEAVFTFLCRYGVHLGFLYENFDRRYSLYLAETFQSRDRLVNHKTPSLLGLGEMMRPHKIEKAEVYLKFSAALYR